MASGEQFVRQQALRIWNVKPKAPLESLRRCPCPGPTHSHSHSHSHNHRHSHTHSLGLAQGVSLRGSPRRAAAAGGGRWR